MGENKETSMPSFGGYMFTQSAMLFVSYGLGYSMPWWVKWFPTLLIPLIIGFTLMIAGVVALIGALID